MLVDPDVGRCRACGLPYRRERGGWALVGPVLLSFQGTYGIESHRSAAMSLDDAGLVTFTPSDGSPARTILRKYLVEIVPALT